MNTIAKTFKTTLQQGPYILISILFSLFVACELDAQNTFKPIGYHNILPNQSKISGNFGELRPNHFHSGIDFKTFEEEGMEVYAAADGYISRVKISSGGYGKAIYITHRDGIVTVYGHLRAFYPAITDVIVKLQENLKSFEVEYLPPKELYPVKGGQLIGISGNTGSSQGPHLHFETRHEKSEKPFNPSIFGYYPEDTIAPVIKSIVLYEPGPANGIFNSRRRIYEIDKLNSFASDTINAGNKLIIGFEGYDLAGNEKNELGIKTYKLFMDDSIVFSSSIDSFLFDENRMINSAIDYEMKIDSGRTISLCYKMAGNKLPFYDSHSGFINLKDNKIYKLKIKVEDCLGNSSDFSFFILCKHHNVKYNKLIGNEVNYGKAKNIITGNDTLFIKKNSFYENGKIAVYGYDTLTSQRKSRTYKIDTYGMAINQPPDFEFKYKSDTSNLESKRITVFQDFKGNLSPAGGSCFKGISRIKIRNSGYYFVMTDTLPPVALEPVFKDDIYSGVKKIIIPLKADISGINKYTIKVNGIPVIGEYNSLRNDITVYLTKKYLPEDLILLEYEISDGLDNIMKSNATLIY